jgi:maltose/moltooligosaccharide transporter
LNPEQVEENGGIHQQWKTRSLIMRLNYGKTFLIGFGFFGISLIWSVYNVYVPIFLHDRFELPPSIIGIVMTLDNIAALLIQPVIGVWSDRTRTRLGRRLPYVVIGAPVAALSFALVPFAQALPLFMASIMGMLLAMALFRTPVIAMMPDVTPSPLRSQANGVINLMGGLGGLIAFFISGTLYKMNPANPFLLGAVLLLASSVLLLVFVRDRGMPDQTDAKRESPFKDFGTLFSNTDKSGLKILLAIFFWFLAYAALETFFSLYARSHLNISETESPVQLGLLSVMFVLFAVPAGIIGGRFGRKKTISVGIAIFVLMLIAAFVLPAQTLAVPLVNLGIGKIYILSLILMVCGIGWALININSLPMVVDLTDESKVGTFTGLYYLFSTLAAIVGPIVNGSIIQLIGNDYNVIMLIAPIFLVAALALMLTVRRGEAHN